MDHKLSRLIIHIIFMVTDSILLAVYAAVLAIILKHRRSAEFNSSYFKIVISIGVSDLWMIIHRYYINVIPLHFCFETAHRSSVGNR